MPYKPKIPCRSKGCPELVESGSGGYCKEHKRVHDSRYQKSRGDAAIIKIYKSKSWETSRRNALYRDAGICVVCGGPANMVDHIKEIKDGGEPFLLENLQSLCNRCHAIKTYESSKDREGT